MRIIYKWTLAIILIFLLHVAIFSIKGGDMTTITVKPSADKVQVGQAFTYTVEIAPDGVIAGGQLNFAFNPLAMRVDSVVQGPFLGVQSFFSGGVINNSVGIVKPVYGVVTTPGQGISTKGVFVIFNCTALSVKPSNVSLTNVILGNLEGIAVPFVWEASQVVFYSAYDLDRNGVVDKADLVLATRQFGEEGTADFNEDGVVDILDLVILVQNFT